jgi:hypothetical protein
VATIARFGCQGFFAHHRHEQLQVETQTEGKAANNQSSASKNRIASRVARSAQGAARQGKEHTVAHDALNQERAAPSLRTPFPMQKDAFLRVKEQVRLAVTACRSNGAAPGSTPHPKNPTPTHN